MKGWVYKDKILYINILPDNTSLKWSSFYDFWTELLPLNYFLQILFFPEGTDFTANTKARSDKFAAKNSLEPYEYVLHPRTAGFSFLVEKMRESMGILLFIKHRLLQSLFVKLLKYFEWLKITL